MNEKKYGEGLSGQEPGRPGGLSEEEKKRSAFFYGGERRGYAEIAQKTSPKEVRHYTRNFIGLMEHLWWRYEQQPNNILIDYDVIPSLITREKMLNITLPLGLGEYSSEDKKAQLDIKPIEREQLAGECGRAAREIQAVCRARCFRRGC